MFLRYISSEAYLNFFLLFLLKDLPAIQIYSFLLHIRREDTRIHSNNIMKCQRIMQILSFNILMKFFSKMNWTSWDYPMTTKVFWSCHQCIIYLCIQIEKKLYNKTKIVVLYITKHF